MKGPVTLLSEPPEELVREYEHHSMDGNVLEKTIKATFLTHLLDSTKLKMNYWVP
jgi:hypothetical protein